MEDYGSFILTENILAVLKVVAKHTDVFQHMHTL